MTIDLTAPDSVINIVELSVSMGIPSNVESDNALASNIEVNFLEYTALSRLFANFSEGVIAGAWVWFCAFAKFKSMAALFGLPPKNDGLIKLKFKFSA
jgi:hypothetical protein